MLKNYATIINVFLCITLATLRFSTFCPLANVINLKIYRTIIVPVFLCGCETWSLTLKEEHRLKVFEKRMLRRIFGPKRDEVTGGWRKPHNEMLHNLSSSPSIMRMMKPRR
jgi:hypothetical protein